MTPQQLPPILPAIPTLTKARPMFNRPHIDKTFLIKWGASIAQIGGYALTGFGITPYNIYLFIIGLIGWFVVGLLWNDKAIILIHLIAFGALIAGSVS